MFISKYREVYIDMATIQTIHPFNVHDHEYDHSTSDAIKNALLPMLANHIKSMPLFSDHMTNFTGDTTDGLTAGFDCSDINLLLKYEGALATVNSDIKISAYYSFLNGNQILYTSDDPVFKTQSTTIYIRALNSYTIKLYTSTNTNGIMFASNASKMIRIFLTKAISLDDPTIVSYMPIFAIYTNNIQASPTNTTDVHFRSVSSEALIFNGCDFVLDTGAPRYIDGFSNTYVLRQYYSNNWRYPDLFKLEGGLAPVYNTTAKIHIGNSDYLYISNGILLKMTD